MNTNRINTLFILNIMFSVTAFFELFPYFTWHSNSYYKYAFILIISILWYNLFLLKWVVIDSINIILLIFAIVIILYSNFSDLGIVIKSLIYNIPLLLFLLMSSENKKKIYIYFSYIFAIALVPGIILYIFNLVNINLSWSQLEPLNPLKTQAGMYYRQYLGSVILYNPHSPQVQGFYRLCGMFDEPGVIGTISVLILTSEGFQIKKNYKNIIILIGGILSFSLAFYIITIMYHIMSSLIKREYRKGIIVLGFLIIIGTLFKTGIVNNNFINSKIIERMTITDGKFIGDNRTSAYFDLKFETMLESGFSNVLFGLGSKATHSDPIIEASASWKKYVYEFGFLGIGMIMLFLVITTFIINKKQNGIMLLSIMIVLMYQRPGVFNLSYLVIFIGGLTYQKEIVLPTKKGVDDMNFD